MSFQILLLKILIPESTSYGGEVKASGAIGYLDEISIGLIRISYKQITSCVMWVAIYQCCTFARRKREN